jgi:hypothetical protein
VNRDHPAEAIEYLKALAAQGAGPHDSSGQPEVKIPAHLEPWSDYCLKEGLTDYRNGWSEPRITGVGELVMQRALQPGKASRKGHPGRKPDTDPKADKRIVDAWKTGRYKTYEQLAKALGGMTKKQVKRAIDRHRHPTKARKRSEAPE